MIRRIRRSKDTQSRQDKNAKKGNMSRSKTVVNQESKRTTKAKIDVDLSANGIYKVYRSPMTCISHTNKTSPPGRRRRIYGVSRKTRTHISIIDHRYIF